MTAAASSPEDSGTAAPDPRIEALAAFYEDGSLTEPEELGFATRAIALIDAADRAAGVIRVRVDDATVEKVARQLHQQDAYEIHNDWDDLSDYRRDAFRDRARGILEALVTP